MAHSPQLVRLLQAESGIANKKPPITSENHQISLGTVIARTPVQTSPSNVLGQCRLTACRKLVLVFEFDRQFGIRNAVPLKIMSEPVRVLGKRILLVDDDQGARESIRLLLNIDRHTVIEAKNGQEALEFFHQSVLDLVIIDYFMPQMEGRELAANIKLSAPWLPILMVTAYLEKLVDTNNPVDAILPKPFGIAELRQTIAKLLN